MTLVELVPFSNGRIARQVNACNVPSFFPQLASKAHLQRLKHDSVPELYKSVEIHAVIRVKLFHNH